MSLRNKLTIAIALSSILASLTVYADTITCPAPDKITHKAGDYTATLADKTVTVSHKPIHKIQFRQAEIAYHPDNTVTCKYGESREFSHSLVFHFKKKLCPEKNDAWVLHKNFSVCEKDFSLCRMELPPAGSNCK